MGLNLQLEFTKRTVYSGDSAGILLKTVLQSGSETVAVFAAVDTGAANCLFERVHGELLGLDIEAGERKGFSTATGRIEAFGHLVLVETMGVQFESMVYFFANPEIQKNLLGRTGWLDRVKLGVVDYDQTLYLAPYQMESQ